MYLKPPFIGYSLWLLSDDTALNDATEASFNTINNYKVPGHVTLAPLLGYGGDEEPLLQKTRELAESLNPFMVKLGQIEQSDGYVKQVFSAAKCEDPLFGLRGMAKRSFGNLCSDGNSYAPHWSFLYGEHDNKTRQRAKTLVLGKATLPRQSWITELALVNAGGMPDEWKIVESFPLKTS